jgi:5'-3' exonuclease
MQIQLLIDGNASGYQAHNGDVMKAADGMQVQAVFGFLTALRGLKEEFPTANIIVLWDGESWRKSVSATYKESRDPDLSEFDPSSSDPKERKRYQVAAEKAADRAAYKAQGPWITRAIKHLGVPQMTCFNYEADDLAALFADRYHEKGFPVRLVTSDGDWMQLIRDRVVWKSNRPPYTFVSTKNFGEKAKVGKDVTGFKDADQFVDAKILYGDKGDSVDGIPGFGDVTLARFFKAFPRIQWFLDTPRAKVESEWMTVAGKAAPKAVLELHEKGFGKGESDVPELALNRTLVDLRTPHRPAPGSIKTERGEFDAAGLMDLCKRLDLYRIVSNFDGFTKTFRGE